MARTFNFNDSLKAANWMMAHLPEILGKNSKQISELVKADTGVDLSREQILRIINGTDGLKHLTDSKCKTSKRFRQDCMYDVSALLAKSIIELADQLGYKMAHEERLRMLIARRLKDAAQEPSNDN